MPARSSWKGYLRLSLVSVPVQAINAVLSGGGKIQLHQLHAACHSRIRYQKVCPVHGEVSNDDIVMGYENAKGEYIVVEDKEIDNLASDGDRAITIDTFVKPGDVDPMYFDGRTYYLVPDGPMGHKPYAVLLRALADEGRWAVGQAMFFGSVQLVIVRPLEGLLCVEMLHYHHQLRSRATLPDEAPAPAVAKEELRLAMKLIEASTRKTFDITRYEDEYTKRLKQLIDAKVAGREFVGPAREEEAPVINLMDALRKSVAQVHRPPARRKPPSSPLGHPKRRRRPPHKSAG